MTSDIAQTNNVEWETPTALGLKRGDVSGLAEDIAQQLAYRPGDPLEPLVARLGGRIEYIDGRNDDENYGSIHVLPGTFLISLPLDSGPLRDRFTIAHELGHFFLHFLYPNQQHAESVRALRANRFGSDQAEWEANWFAAAFLMPTGPFRETFDEVDGDLLAIGNKFKVSQQAAAVRAKSLSLRSSRDAERA